MRIVGGIHRCDVACSLISEEPKPNWQAIVSCDVSFAIVLEKVRGFVINFAREKKHLRFHDAEDLAQDVTLKVSSQLQAGKMVAKTWEGFWCFVGRIAANSFTDQIRHTLGRIHKFVETQHTLTFAAKDPVVALVVPHVIPAGYERDDRFTVAVTGSEAGGAAVDARWASDDVRDGRILLRATGRAGATVTVTIREVKAVPRRAKQMPLDAIGQDDPWIDSDLVDDLVPVLSRSLPETGLDPRHAA